MANFQTNGRMQILDHTGRPASSSSRPAVGMPVEHYQTFISKQGGFGTYWHDRFDEAMRHGREEALTMKNDAFLEALLNERYTSVVGLNWHLEVPDEKDSMQMRVKDGLTRLVKGIPFFRRMLLWWLQALWYGKSGVQVKWEWTTFRDREPDRDADKQDLADMAGAAAMGGAPPPKPESGPGKLRRGLTVRRAWEVNGDKIGHAYDHTPYILVYGPDADNIENAEFIPTTAGGRGLLLRGSWRDRFIIHKHLMEDADYFTSDRAESIHGVGIRSKIYWLWWLKMEWLGNVTNFFDRVGLGVTIWKYPMGNDQALQAIKTAATDQSDRAHIFVPVVPGSGKDGDSNVARVEVPTSGSEALLKLVEYADRNIERYIIGQEASSKGSSSGLGNEASAEMQRSTKTNITIQDAFFLAETITGSQDEPGLINTMQKHTYPESDFPVRFVFDVERGESERKLQAAKVLVEMGLRVRADEVRAAAGFGKPTSGDEVLDPETLAKAQQAMQPQDPMAAMGMGGPGGPGGGMPGMPGGDDPGGVEPQAPAGDFIDAIRQSKEHASRMTQAIRYLRRKNKGEPLAAALAAAAARWAGRGDRG